MRLGARSDNEFLGSLSKKSEKISEFFQKNIERITSPVKVKVMLGDTTITEQATFSPQEIREFFSKLLNKLPDWHSEGISTTNDEDLRRVFVKLERRIGNYVLLWHMSLQYHALLYYKPDNQVQVIQKELAEIMDKTINKEKELAELTNDLIKERLVSLGYKEPDEQRLFEILFNDDKLREEITTEVDRRTDFDFKAKDQRKKELFKELDNLLVETYQTTSVLIDDNRLVAGEEGCVSTFDLDFMKKKTKEAIFDPKKISDDTKQKISDALDEIIKALS